jgi:hypothetical protein
MVSYIPENEVDRGAAIQCIQAADEHGLINAADIKIGKPINKGLSRLILYGAHKILMLDALHNFGEIPPVIGSDSSDQELLSLIASVQARTGNILDDPN